MLAGCALVGGETAEHPGLLGPDEYDVAGAGDRCRRGRRRCWAPTGCATATSSSRWPPPGLHSNGYSLVRHVLLSRPAGWSLDREVAELGRTARRGAAGADPDLRAGLPGADRAPIEVHALCHVTGGGLAANLARVLPAHLSRRRRPVDLDAAAGVRRWSASSGRVARPSWSAPSTWASAWSPWSRRRTADAAVALLTAAGCRPGSRARSRRRRHVTPARRAPGLRRTRRQAGRPRQSG